MEWYRTEMKAYQVWEDYDQSQNPGACTVLVPGLLYIPGTLSSLVPKSLSLWVSWPLVTLSP